MKTIGVDIDDTIAAHIPELVAYSNKHYGTNLTEDTYIENWALFWDVDHTELMRRAQLFHQESVAQLKKIDNADAVLSRLAQKYHLVIITARPKYNIDATYEWLETHYKGIFEEVHFVPIWDELSTLTKADICKQVGADYLIDDIRRHCNAAAEAGITALLYGNYTWSKNEQLHPDVVPVKNWHAVAEYFDV